MKKQIDYIFLFILFFTSNDTILFGTNSFVPLTYISRIIPVLFIVYSLLSAKKKNESNTAKLIILFLLSFIVTVSFLINDGEISTLLSRLIAITTGCFIAMYYSYDIFKKAFVSFIKFNAIFSIVLCVLAYVAPNFLMLFPTIYNVSSTPFKTCIFSSIMFPTSSSFIRVSGVFWEPGAFSICINIALMMMLFGKTRYKSYDYLLLILTLVLTFSTAGYIGLLFLLFIYFFFKKKAKTSYTKYIALGVLAVACALVLLSNSMIYDMVFGKIIENSSSSAVRFSSFFGGLQLSLKNPFFGVFSTNIQKEISLIAPASGGMLTSTFVYQFASFGLIFGIIYTFLNFRFFYKYVESSIFCKILLLAFFILIFFSETFFSFFPFVFAFLGAKEKNKKHYQPILCGCYENSCN